jgi:hypothetical protein
VKILKCFFENFTNFYNLEYCLSNFIVCSLIAFEDPAEEKFTVRKRMLFMLFLELAEFKDNKKSHLLYSKQVHYS